MRLRVTNKKTVLHHLEEHLYVSDIAEHPLLYKDLHLVYRPKTQYKLSVYQVSRFSTMS